MVAQSIHSLSSLICEMGIGKAFFRTNTPNVLSPEKITFVFCYERLKLRPKILLYYQPEFNIMSMISQDNSSSA